MATVWEPARVLEQLRALGVRAGDAVMVHASLRAIGPVRGGAEALVEVLDRSVGASGSLMMTLGALDTWSGRAGDEAVPFDAAVTPADPDVGVLAEVLRTAPGTLVSDHPEGRFGARGALARDLTRDVPWDHYYGPGSPLERFVDAGGRVLRLGADPDTTTLIHLAEYRAPLAHKHAVQRRPLVLGPDGPVVRPVECLDDSDGIAEYPGVEGDEFGAILTDFLATGAASIGRVGLAESALLDGGELVRFAERWIGEHAAPEINARG